MLDVFQKLQEAGRQDKVPPTHVKVKNSISQIFASRPTIERQPGTLGSLARSSFKLSELFTLLYSFCSTGLLPPQTRGRCEGKRRNHVAQTLAVAWTKLHQQFGQRLSHAALELSSSFAEVQTSISYSIRESFESSPRTWAFNNVQFPRPNIILSRYALRICSKQPRLNCIKQ